MIDPHTITYFARDVLTIACQHDCTWAHLEPLAATDDSLELVTSVRATQADGAVHIIESSQVPVAARLASCHPRSSIELRAAVLEQDARYLRPADAHAILQILLFRTIRHAA